MDEDTVALTMDGIMCWLEYILRDSSSLSILPVHQFAVSVTKKFNRHVRAYGVHLRGQRVPERREQQHVKGG